MAELEKGPMIVAAHSLGTVVTFKLLRALGQAGRQSQTHLYVTLGSPLGLRAVSSALGLPFMIPDGVTNWLNAVEPDDSVTLGKALDANTFTGGIENILDISSASVISPHDAEGYLKDIRVARRIEQALIQLG